MSEQLIHSGENLNKSPEPEAPKHEKVDREASKDTGPEKHNHSIDKLKQSIHQEAKSTREFSIENRHDTDSQPVLGVQRELKANAYKRTLHKVQTHLRPTEQTFSKFIHRPKIEAVSEMSSKTIARPSGLLGGGILALIGSGILLYMSKHNGFRYNFTLFLLLFVSGFIVGALFEIVLGRRSRSKQPN